MSAEMPDFGFDRLTRLYDHVEFDAAGGEGSLRLDTEEVMVDLLTIEGDDRAAADTGVVLLSDVDDLRLGGTVRVRLDPPRPTLGLLARNLDGLLAWPGATLTEPREFYVIEGRYQRSTVPAPAELTSYRRVLAVVALMGEAAEYLDPVRREMMFVRDGRVPVPVRFDASDVTAASEEASTGLLALFEEDTHRDQKLAILAETVVAVAAAQPQAARLGHVLRHLGEVSASLRDGYRLFASEFSYEKIRSDIEDARLDYLAKIHKTFVDVQGQMLGIPIATVVVASQLKPARTCGAEFWTDVAVLAGAWVFSALLWLALENQRLTLAVVESEVTRQQAKIATDYAAIGDRFSTVFAGLTRRISWQRTVLIGIGVIGLVGVGLTTAAFAKLVDVPLRSCLAAPLVGSPNQGSGPGQLSVRL